MTMTKIFLELWHHSTVFRGSVAFIVASVVVLLLVPGK